jgi:hypothetical protein
MATAVNFKVTQGDTFDIVVTYKDPNGDPVPLTDYTITSQVRDDFGGKILSASCTLGDGITVDEENGIINLSYSPNKTQKFTVPKAALQLQITSPVGKKTTLIYSYIHVDKAAIQSV